MKFGIAVLALVGLCIAGFQFPLRAQGPLPPPQPQRPAPTRSVWDGVYTIGQARRGSVHTDLCAPCHGSDLEGDFAPTLMGATFAGKWSGRTVGDLFELIEINFEAMNKNTPSDDPQGRNRQQSADFLAYILLSNQFPAGKTELPSGLDTLRQIRIEAKP
jgi:hypothetical protein